jgi:DNA topoisomerase-1
VKDGRFGPYVTDGETNASLRKGDTIEGITIERAAELLQIRRDAGPAKKVARGAKKAPAKKAAAKKTAKKATTKKAAPKRAPAKKAAAPAVTVAADDTTDAGPPADA